MRRENGIALRLRSGGVAVLLVLLVFSIVLTAQSNVWASTSGRGIEIGVTGGLLLVPSITSLATFGVSAGVSLSDYSALRFAVSHAGLGMFGVELYGITFLDLAAQFETSWRQPLGIYGFGGASYVLAGGLGESVTGVVFLGGLGVRISPADFMTIRLGDTIRAKNGAMHVLEAGLAFRF